MTRHVVASPASERGQWLQRPDGLRVLITLHPSALLRLPPRRQGAGFQAFVSDLRMAAPFAGR